MITVWALTRMFFSGDYNLGGPAFDGRLIGTAKQRIQRVKVLLICQFRHVSPAAVSVFSRPWISALVCRQVPCQRSGLSRPSDDPAFDIAGMSGSMSSVWMGRYLGSFRRRLYSAQHVGESCGQRWRPEALEVS